MVSDFFLDDNAAGRGAALPGGGKGARESGFHRKLQIRVGQDNNGILAAHFALNLLETLRAASVKLRADFVRAGERQPVNVGTLNEFIARVAPRAHDEIQHARRKACLRKDFDDFHRRERGDCGRLEDDRVAADEGGRDLPNGNRDGEIPGRDSADDPEGLANRVGKIFRKLARQRFAIQAARFAGHEFRDVDGALNFAERILEGLAFFAGEEASELFLVLLHDLRGFEENLAAVRSGSVAPAGKRGASGGDGFLHLLARGKRDARDDFIGVGGIPAVDDLRRLRFDPLAVDEILTELGGCHSSRHA